MQKKLEHNASNKIILKGGTVQIFGTPPKKIKIPCIKK